MSGPGAPGGVPPIPARMLNEYVYCSRLFFLEFVEGLFAESADTVEEALEHWCQDRSGEETDKGAAAVEEEPELVRRTRALHLSDEALGLTARLDVVDQAGGAYCPVDYSVVL